MIKSWYFVLEEIAKLPRLKDTGKSIYVKNSVAGKGYLLRKGHLVKASRSLVAFPEYEKVILLPSPDLSAFEPMTKILIYILGLLFFSLPFQWVKFYKIIRLESLFHSLKTLRDRTAHTERRGWP